MTPDQAEATALKALAYVIGSDELRPVFLGSSGSSLEDARAGAGDPDFLGSVLDFLLMDDAWIVPFCDAHHLPYEAPLQARAHLPGGQQVNWT